MIYIYFTINLILAIYSYDKSESISKVVIHLLFAIPLYISFIGYAFIMIFYYKWKTMQKHTNIL